MSKPTNIGGLKSLGKATKPSSHVGEYSADPVGGSTRSVPKPGKPSFKTANSIFGSSKV